MITFRNRAGSPPAFKIVLIRSGSGSKAGATSARDCAAPEGLKDCGAAMIELALGDASARGLRARTEVAEGGGIWWEVTVEPVVVSQVVECPGQPEQHLRGVVRAQRKTHWEDP